MFPLCNGNFLVCPVVMPTQNAIVVLEMEKLGKYEIDYTFFFWRNSNDQSAYAVKIIRKWLAMLVVVKQHAPVNAMLR
jgi:hypothetical protein